MIRGQSIRGLYESHGPRDFVRHTLVALGLCDRHLRRHYDRAGNQRLVAPSDASGRALDRFRPDEYSFKDLAESIIGHDWAEQLRPDRLQRAALMEAQAPLMEAGNAPVMPSAFANINAFTAVVAGLLEVSVLEGWENPDFIADQLMPAESTKMFEGRKKIGVTRVGDQAEERLPGMPTKRVQVGERWITQPRTVENALSCEVTQEAVLLDLTGEVLREANDLGTWLGYRKELRCIDAFVGVTNTYSYKGTSYNTYLSASTWDNDFSNELLHESDIEEALIKFRDMKDPETNTRVLIRPNAILVQRGKLRTLQSILGDTAEQFQYRGATTAAHQINVAKPAYKGQFTIVESPLVYERINASDGLNVSASNSEKYWWMYEKGKAIVYAQNWPMRTQQAAPHQADMIDRGVVLFVKADERGVPFWQEPRRVVRCKN